MAVATLNEAYTTNKANAYSSYRSYDTATEVLSSTTAALVTAGPVGWILALGTGGSALSTKLVANSYEDLYTNYSTLSETLQNYNTAQSNASYYENLIDELNEDYENSSEFVTNYEEMLSYINGDTSISNESNLVLETMKQNQATIDTAESTLASYRESSALEINASIEEGLQEYQNQRSSQALANIYASAGGSIAGAYNSSARRTQASIRALVGDDMVFNTAADGSVSAEGIGTYARTMLALQSAIKTNIQTYENNIASAKLAYNTDLQTYEDSYTKALKSVNDYADTYKDYTNTLLSYQQQAEDYKTSAKETLKTINSAEESRGYEKTEINWGE